LCAECPPECVVDDKSECVVDAKQTKTNARQMAVSIGGPSKGIKERLKRHHKNANRDVEGLLDATSSTSIRPALVLSQLA
jgi:hypothetical protein